MHTNISGNNISPYMCVIEKESYKSTNASCSAFFLYFWVHFIFVVITTATLQKMMGQQQILFSACSHWE